MPRPTPFPARRTVLIALLVGLPWLQATTNKGRSSACAITGPDAACAGRSAKTGCGDAACATATPCGLTGAFTDDQRPTFPPALLSLLHAQFAEEVTSARVYRTFSQLYPDVHPFQNIPQAEDRHSGSIATLLASADPAFSLSAMISDPTYSSLGDELIARGSQSEVEALRTGAYMEERDILDLRALAERLDHADAKAIVAQLELGSNHHLTAFVRNLQRHGITYEPQLLSAEAYAAILRGRAR